MDLYLKLTDEQRAIIMAIHQQRCAEQLAAQFADPALDAKTIRAIVHMQGQTHALTHLLEFDQLLQAQKEQEKQDLLQSNGDQPIS